MKYNGVAINHYRPRTKFAKVMFLHVSVILFTGGLQAHTQGEVEGSGWGQGFPGPYPGEVGVWLWGVGAPDLGVSWPRQGMCIPACTEADPQQMATAADGTHPTGMHSCYWK